MKYAIANQQGIVYTIRDTADGFRPDATRGELCVPITDEQAAVVRPHYAVQWDGSFAPREADDQTKERAAADLERHLEERKEQLREQAGKSLVAALLAEDRAAEAATRKQLAADLARVDADRPALASAIGAARTYFELPAAVRHDGGEDVRSGPSVARAAVVEGAVLHLGHEIVRPLARS